MVTCYVDTFGNLCDLKTGDELRAATEAETDASATAALLDGGIGAIEVDVAVDYATWWAGVFGQRSASAVVEEFDLVEEGLGEWLGDAEAEARHMGMSTVCPGAYVRALDALTEAIAARVSK